MSTNWSDPGYGGRFNWYSLSMALCMGVNKASGVNKKKKKKKKKKKDSYGGTKRPPRK
jgi:hypothetical protein